MPLAYLEIIKDVHSPLKWEDYERTSVVQNTNCFSHAIGSTVITDKKLYRLGVISGKKGIDEHYYSKEEVKQLFLSDLEIIKLDVEEIPIIVNDKTEIVNHITKIELKNNEHIVVLFVKIYGKEQIRDFHFIRYDKVKGWSEKRFRNKVTIFEDIIMSWPDDWNDRMIGIWKISR